MNQKTINDFNQLNQKFYAQVADSFSDSRSHPWGGWSQLVAHLDQFHLGGYPETNVLDLGCGNGRFVDFLAAFFDFKINYLGVDNDDELLKIAKNKNFSKIKNFNVKFQKLDIAKLLIADLLAENLSAKNWSIIVLMGVMHHIPSFKLRIKLLSNLSNLMSRNSYLVVTFWQFHQSKRMMGKVIQPKLVGIDPHELEPNDFILDWQRGETAYRYCHSFTNEEIDKLISESGQWEVKDGFNADGKEKLNKYLVLQKI